MQVIAKDIADATHASGRRANGEDEAGQRKAVVSSSAPSKAVGRLLGLHFTLSSFPPFLCASANAERSKASCTAGPSEKSQTRDTASHSAQVCGHPGVEAGVTFERFPR